MSLEKRGFNENEQNFNEHTEYYTVGELNRYAERVSKAVFESLDGEENDVIHFPGEKDSKFLMKWMQDNMIQLVQQKKLSLKDGITVYFDDDPSYGGYTICKLNEDYYQPGELEEKYGENGNFWDARNYDGRSERKLKIDGTWYAIYSK